MVVAFLHPRGFYFLAGPVADVGLPIRHPAELQPLGLPCERWRRHESRLCLRLLALVELGKLAEQHVRDHEAEHGVSEKLHRLVVAHAAADVLVRLRRVRHRVLEQPAIVEAVRDRLLQRLELITQTDDLAVAQLSPMAVDDALRLVGLGRVHRDAHLAKASDRHRQHAARLGRDDRHDAVRLEQASDDTRFDIGRGGEDGDEL